MPDIYFLIYFNDAITITVYTLFVALNLGTVFVLFLSFSYLFLLISLFFVSATPPTSHPALCASFPPHARQCPIFTRPPQHDLCPQRWPSRASCHYASANKGVAVRQSSTSCAQDPATEFQREQPQWLHSSRRARGSGQTLPVTYQI